MIENDSFTVKCVHIHFRTLLLLVFLVGEGFLSILGSWFLVFSIV